MPIFLTDSVQEREKAPRPKTSNFSFKVYGNFFLNVEHRKARDCNVLRLRCQAI